MEGRILLKQLLSFRIFLWFGINNFKMVLKTVSGLLYKAIISAFSFILSEL